MFRSARSISFLAYFLMLAVSSCRMDSSEVDRKVSIQNLNGKYSLIKNGKVFSIKGASGYTNLEELKLSGGNTIRVWDTTHIEQILREANKYDISVIVGLPLPESKYLAFYDDTARTAKEIKKIERFIEKFKSDPALLMWCVGNELYFPIKPSYNSFYKMFNDVVDIIHKVDPDHPVTTTMVNFQKQQIVNIRLRTNVDIISFNIFSSISVLRDDLDDFSWFWDGPYMITEWGIDGPWTGNAHTVWQAKLEQTSTQKAKNYLSRYEKFMPVNDPRFLGSFIFFWGQKQEITHTWFSLFDEKGQRTEVVDIAKQIWTGKPSEYSGPVIQGLLLAEKKGSDNIFFEPHQIQSAKIYVKGGIKSQIVKWEIYPEDWFKKNNVNNLIRPVLLQNLITRQLDREVFFQTPEKEGPYRIFATVSDDKGNIATANIPFYVISQDE